MGVVFHDPSARLDYQWDWGAADIRGRTWLGDDTIATATVTTDDDSIDLGITLHDDTKVTCWIQGGVVGRVVRLRCHITTAGNREDDRTLYLKVLDR